MQERTAPERIAKVMARAGLCSRREAEKWIADGRVSVNGETLQSPAVTVTDKDKIIVDGKPLPQRDRTRLFLFNKPKGLVTTQRDPERRKTVFDVLPADLPRVVTIGRLDITTEGLLLLTNDGGLARALELPANAWQRHYRARALGKVTQDKLDRLAEGVTINGVRYQPINASLEGGAGGANLWVTLTLTEGKNREVRRVLEYLGLKVNRLIRTGYGPFSLGGLAPGAVEEVARKDVDALTKRMARNDRRGG